MDVLTQLLAELPGRVSTDSALLERYRTDRSGQWAAGRPLALVLAETIDDVQAACRIAHNTGTPLVTRGAGTGLAGGANAGGGEIVLSTERMTSILAISAADRLAVVQPGILNGELNRALNEQHLWWTPDPVSKEISTVGGNIATNAGGLLCAKYGVTRESVLALKVVLADGRLISVGHQTVKGVTGYDLCALMIGSEGTLGIIVECTLKVRPMVPGTVQTIGVFFDHVNDAASAAAAITSAGLDPAVMELLDATMLDCVSRYTGEPLIERGNAFLLIQCDGPGASEEGSQAAQIARDCGGQTEVAPVQARAERLLEVRSAGFPAMEALGTVLVEDVAVPRSQVPAMFAMIAELESRYELMIPTTCHAGDGNLHPSFIFDGPTAPEHVWQAAEELFRYALALGGTLTGEHGVGVLKSRWLSDELGEEQFSLQRAIKAVFDPTNILNPGKMFPRS